MADAAEATVAGSDLRFQHARHAVAEAQVGVPDNAGAQPTLPKLSARAHRRRAVDEFDFADRPHFRRPVGAVHRAAFDKDALRDVVTAAGIGEQLVEQVTVPAAIPQMMVRIDDLERRLQDFFFALRPPSGIAVARGRRPSRCARGSRRGRLRPRLAGNERRAQQACCTREHRPARYRTPSNRRLCHRPSSWLCSVGDVRWLAQPTVTLQAETWVRHSDIAAQE
jgi:hypothetical protein